MTKLKPRHKLPHFTQLQELASEKWEQTLQLRVNGTQNNQGDADQTTTFPISRRLSELTVLSCPPLRLYAPETPL